ncbi:MAG: SDR family oxidoreductase [Phyllobacteriaceae bacterium]|nr:SDR family oxidoreductase [Phyllobacteriaceae bacterium]
MPSILITGCSTGIGAYCARALHAEGWRVFATARTAEDVARLAADGLEALHLDYTDAASVSACADAVLAATQGKLDALFNNGAYGQAGAVEDLSTDALRRQFEANFFGWHQLTCALLPAMRAQGHGRIIMNSSILGRVPLGYRGAYAASKYALEGLTRCLQIELAGSGVHACLIEPGPVASQFAANGLAHFEREIDIEGSVHRTAYQVQMQRLMKGGRINPGKVTPEVVMKALRHALSARKPRLSYPVTREARIGLVLQRLLPEALFQRIMADRV